MKRILVVLFMSVMFALNTSAQQKTYFCEVEYGGRIWFDFGRKVNLTLWGSEYSPTFVDENGKEFESLVDVANLMTEHGWELKHTYGRGGDDNWAKYYVFSKTVNTIEELADGFVTKEEYKRKNRKK